ncbi:MAG: decaprenyl-phosphate phosphoribosyltransferase [Phycisphaerae bacterium]
MAHIRLLRVSQWVKNIFVFAGLIFGQKMGDLPSVYATLLGFACLCLLSSSVYVMNDISDRDEDRRHPRKCKRPIASGEVAVPTAMLMTLGLAIGGLGGAWLLDRGFFLIAAAYVVLQIAYTFVLKHQVVLDVICIATGFVLRAIAGAVLVHVAISVWLVVCTFTLCLFMGFSKRRCELNAMLENNGTAASHHRRTLAIYTPELLNHMTTMTAGIAVVSFLLYTTDARTIETFKTNYLVYTLPLVVYAVFRFAVLVEHGKVDGPTEVLLKDFPFQAAIVLWAAAAILIVYRGVELKSFFERMAGAP